MAIRVVLDTCVVRASLHGDLTLPVDELEARKGEFLFCISDTALAELVVQLCEGRLPIDTWKRSIDSIARILDPVQPILPGQRELAHLAGLNDSPPDYGEQLDTNTLYNGLWHKVASVTSVEELNQGFEITDQQGTIHTMMMSCVNFQDVLEQERKVWRNWIRDTQTKLSRADVKKSDIESLMTEGLCGLFGADAEKKRQVAPMSSMLVMYATLATQEKNPLNPEAEKRRGDYFDFSMLLALALPDSIFCTRDGRFQRAVRSTGVAAGNRVILPNELFARIANGTLAELL